MGLKKKGIKMRQKLAKSLRIRVEKMSAFCLSTMLMKTNELHRPLHDVDEDKGVIRFGEIRKSKREMVLESSIRGALALGMSMPRPVPRSLDWDAM
jgi:hypothetical protein